MGWLKVRALRVPLSACLKSFQRGGAGTGVDSGCSITDFNLVMGFVKRAENRKQPFKFEKNKEIALTKYGLIS